MYDAYFAPVIFPAIEIEGLGLLCFVFFFEIIAQDLKDTLDLASGS